MVPLGSVLNVKQSYGPDQVTHYNGYPAADINGSAAPGVSAGEAVQRDGAARGDRRCRTASGSSGRS